MNAENTTVQEDQVGWIGIQLLCSHQTDIQHSQIVRHLAQCGLILSITLSIHEYLISGNISENSQRLHETTLLTFRSITRTDHTVLRRLESTRTANLLRLLDV